MTEHDENSSVDDAALVSAQAEGLENAPAPQQEDRTGRVQQLIRDKRAAEALAATSAAQAAALRERSQSGGRPQDFRAPEDYTRAVAEQAVREVGAEILARQASQAQEIASRAAQDAWAESTAGFREKAPDFDAVVHNPSLTVTPVMADAIRESSRGAEIAYYLGKNPAEAARIASLPPVSQATAIARLETRVGSAGQASVSRAPQPVSTLPGRSGSAGKRLEDMNFEEYRRARGF
ncbi:MAG: hypothetical protein WB610_08090 [Rhodomicrobium sp.]